MPNSPARHVFGSLVKAELFKAARSRPLWALSGVVLLLVLYNQYLSYNSARTLVAGLLRSMEFADAAAEPDRTRVLENLQHQMRAVPFEKASFAAIAAIPFAGSILSSGLGLILGVVAGVAAMGVEYSNETLRTLLPVAPRRGALIAAKLTAALVCYLVLAVVITALVALLYIVLDALAPIAGPPTASWAALDAPPPLFAFASIFPVFLAAALLAMLLTVLARSAIVGALITVLAVVIDISVANGSASVGRFSLSNAILSLTSPYTRALAGDFGRPLWFDSLAALPLSAWTGAITLAIGAAAFGALGVASFRRQDVA